MPHVQLTDGGPFLPAVRNAVDDQRASAADAFATVGIERDRVLPAPDEVLVDQIQHFEKRHVRHDVPGFVGREATGRARVLLPPDF